MPGMVSQGGSWCRYAVSGEDKWFVWWWHYVSPTAGMRWEGLVVSVESFLLLPTQRAIPSVAQLTKEPLSHPAWPACRGLWARRDLLTHATTVHVSLLLNTWAASDEMDRQAGGTGFQVTDPLIRKWEPVLEECWESPHSSHGKLSSMECFGSVLPVSNYIWEHFCTEEPKSWFIGFWARECSVFYYLYL